MNYQEAFKQLKPIHDFLICIDSDGCVFDNMEVKQKEFFVPNALKYFDLFAISKILRETWEFVNLYSIYRGGNRFTSLIKVFELLEGRKEIKDSNFKLPDLLLLKKWVDNETKLSNGSLLKFFESNYSTDLEKVVSWTIAVNKDISEWLRNIPPFPSAIAAIKKIASFADIIIVSQTPLEAIDREWKEHNLKKFVKAIAGQEHGTKSEHIALAKKEKYRNDKVLMIGDAKGDLEAAKNNGILFYPIIPGNENISWDRLLHEGLRKLISGNYAGRYEQKLLSEFANSLPEIPYWER